MTFFAPSIVSVFRSTVCALAKNVPLKIINAKLAIFRLVFISFSPAVKGLASSTEREHWAGGFSQFGLRNTASEWPRPIELHAGFRRNRHAKELRVIRPASILHPSHNAMFVGPSVRSFLPRTLVGTDSDLFIDLRPRIPQNELRGHVAAGGISLGVEQRDTVRIRRVEPIV